MNWKYQKKNWRNLTRMKNEVTIKTPLHGLAKIKLPSHLDMDKIQKMTDEYQSKPFAMFPVSVYKSNADVFYEEFQALDKAMQDKIRALMRLSK